MIWRLCVVGVARCSTIVAHGHFIIPPQIIPPDHCAHAIRTTKIHTANHLVHLLNSLSATRKMIAGTTTTNTATSTIGTAVHFVEMLLVDGSARHNLSKESSDLSPARLTTRNQHDGFLG